MSFISRLTVVRKLYAGIVALPLQKTLEFAGAVEVLDDGEQTVVNVTAGTASANPRGLRGTFGTASVAAGATHPLTLTDAVGYDLADGEITTVVAGSIVRLAGSGRYHVAFAMGLQHAGSPSYPQFAQVALQTATDQSFTSPTTVETFTGNAAAYTSGRIYYIIGDHTIANASADPIYVRWRQLTDPFTKSVATNRWRVTYKV